MNRALVPETPQPTLEELSRQLRLEIDGTGAIVHADSVAERLLGVRPGVRFVTTAVPGTEGKVHALLDRARRTAVHDWELGLVVTGAPCLVVCSALPGEHAGHVELIGLALPFQYGGALEELSQSLEEIVRLNRDLSRQRKELTQQQEELRQVIRDLDDSKRGVVLLHAELEESNESLRRTSDEKSRLVANVSHELRTPLHTILALSRLLEEDESSLSEEQRTHAHFIHSAASELSEFVNDLLQLSLSASGKTAPRPETFEATEFIAALRGIMVPLATRPEVALIFEEVTATDMLETDHGRLLRVARNLVTNALKFTRHGEVRVSLNVHAEDVVLRVSDTGVGIAEEHLELIFEEFLQVAGPLRRVAKGAGLGLPIARRLTEMLGGKLSVESQVGKGSVFTVTVPRVLPVLRAFSVLEGRPIDPSRVPVLVVEDDRSTIVVYDRLLASSGFQVVPARDTETARRILGTIRPAAILLDIMLDGETSWGFLSEIKQTQRTADIPVFVVTVSQREPKARSLGADEFWVKPLEPERLLQKLRSLGRHAPANDRS